MNSLVFHTRTQPSAVIVLVLGGVVRIEYEYEYHFIEYEYDRWQENTGDQREVSFFLRISKPQKSASEMRIYITESASEIQKYGKFEKLQVRLVAKGTNHL